MSVREWVRPLIGLLWEEIRRLFPLSLLHNRSIFMIISFIFINKMSIQVTKATDFWGKTVMNKILCLGLLNMINGSKI